MALSAEPGVTITLREIYDEVVRSNVSTQEFHTRTAMRLEAIEASLNQNADAVPHAVKMAEEAKEVADQALHDVRTMQTGFKRLRNSVVGFLGAVVLALIGGWAQNHIK